MNTITRHFLYLTVGIFLTSCWNKDKDEFSNINSATWTPQFALPLFTSVLTTQDSLPIILPKLTLVDTASIELPLGSDQDVNSYVVSAEFKAVTSNSFPISGHIQIYFADSNNVYIDSLLTLSQTTVAAGTPSAPSTQELIIPVDKDKYNELTKAKKMYVILRLNTSGIGGSLSQYKYTSDVGIKATLTTQITTN